MVRPCLTVENQSKVLRWLATEIINAIHPEETVEDLLANPCLLHSYMLKTSVDWHWISNEVGVDEKKVSRWYYETHLRHILTKIVERFAKLSSIGSAASKFQTSGFTKQFMRSLERSTHVKSYG